MPAPSANRHSRPAERHRNGLSGVDRVTPPGDTPRAPTVWSAFPADTAYFGAGAAGWMLNYRVADLDAMLAQLRAAGVWVADEVQDGDYGRFGWAADLEGNRFELWQPPASAPPSGADAAMA